MRRRIPSTRAIVALIQRKSTWEITSLITSLITGFAKPAGRARRAYAAYVEAGIEQGRRADLIGGRLIRSVGGWADVEHRRAKGRALMKSDERILGEADIVEAVLAQAQERYSRQTAWQRRGVGVEQLVARVAEVCQVNPEDVVAQGRQRRKVRARNLLCFWAVRELGLSLTEMARRLGMSPPGVGYVVQRCEAMARACRYDLR